ncbi:MAG: hypothetical protein GF320_14315 [Armatimonadia bacterium]|nr:hypothetical protein [Armatimonadia bacterium]
MDELTRMTELQTSSGTNLVLAGIFALGVFLGVLVFVWAARRVAKAKIEIEEEQSRQRLALDKARADAELAENRAVQEQFRHAFSAMMTKMLGNGSGDKGEFGLIHERLEQGDKRMDSIEQTIDSIAQNLTEHIAAQRGVRPDCDERLSRIEDAIGLSA